MSSDLLECTPQTRGALLWSNRIGSVAGISHLPILTLSVAWLPNIGPRDARSFLAFSVNVGTGFNRTARSRTVPVVMLLTLAQKGVIELPPSQSPIIRAGKKTRRRKFTYDTTPLDGCASRAGKLHFSMVRRTAKEGFWDHLIETYHYLGNPRIVGSHLKYLVSLDGRPVAALG